MEDRGKGVMMQRIPRKEHTDIAVPDQLAPEWMVEFIENVEDFNSAGLEIDGNKYEVELKAYITVTKNDKNTKTYPLKLNKEEIARAVLKKLMRL